MRRGAYRSLVLILAALGGVLIWLRHAGAPNLYLDTLGGSTAAGRMLQLLCFGGIGLGRRCGVTPLFPLVMAGTFLSDLSPWGVSDTLAFAVPYTSLALAGNLIGAAVHKKRRLQGGATR